MRLTGNECFSINCRRLLLAPLKSPTAGQKRPQFPGLSGGNPDTGLTQQVTDGGGS